MTDQKRDATRVVHLPVLVGCPWCGRSPAGLDNDGFYTYQCSGVGSADGHLAVVHGETEPQAFDNWNAAYSRQQKVIDRLREALEKIERMPWPDSESPYALIARQALSKTEEGK